MNSSWSNSWGWQDGGREVNETPAVRDSNNKSNDTLAMRPLNWDSSDIHIKIAYTSSPTETYQV